MAFKRDLKEVSEGADRRPGSRELMVMMMTEETAVENATLASAGINCRRVSICLSVCHKSVFY